LLRLLLPPLSAFAPPTHLPPPLAPKSALDVLSPYICYDRHFPEGARALGLAGAEIVFIPSATTAGHSEYLWKLEQTAHAVANGYFVGTNNRVGLEAPWNFGHFYGTSYFADPRGKILVEGSREKEELVVGDLDLDVIQEVRTQWQFFRDRRTDLYGPLLGAPHRDKK
jgi:beta-ureidopropionase